MNDLICPYCETEISDEWGYRMDDEEQGRWITINCYKCESEFKAYFTYETIWKVKKMEKDNGEKNE